MLNSDNFRNLSAQYLAKARVTPLLRIGSLYRKMASGYAALADNEDWLNGVIPADRRKALNDNRRQV